MKTKTKTAEYVELSLALDQVLPELKWTLAESIDARTRLYTGSAAGWFVTASATAVSEEGPRGRLLFTECEGVATHWPIGEPSKKSCELALTERQAERAIRLAEKQLGERRRA